MHLLIPAAGSGKRMGGDRNKLLLPLLKQPILAWTLRAAEQSSVISWVGIIGQPHDFSDFRAIFESLHLKIPIHLIPGGTTRQESVFNGLQALPIKATQVLIHDGARCLISPQLFARCVEGIKHCQGLIAAVPVKDTIKVINNEGFIQETPNRQKLWAAQTPQAFQVMLLKNCHEKGRLMGWSVTDDAALLEMCELPVKIIEGEETNLKITTPVDLAIAEFILQQRQ